MAEPGMEKKPKDSFWTFILREMEKRRDSKLPSHKSVLVLGDNASGKSSLIAKLYAAKVPEKGFGLEYTYIKVRDEGENDVTLLSVWILHNDNTAHTNLLKFALNEQNFPHTLVILTVSMDTPWNWMERLQHFMQILTEHVAGLQIHPEEMQQCQARLTKAWQNYCETIGEPYAGASTKHIGELNALPLPEGVLTNNLGLDLVIAVTKTDYMGTLAEKFDFRYAHFDFMQQCVRRFCLAYGASLIYTSVKEDKNCDILYQYLLHRIYGLPFQASALVIEKDAVLIPAGWDNINKINILNETLHSFKSDDRYSDVITQPAWETTVLNREDEMQTTYEQAFLARLQKDQLQAQSTPVKASPVGSPKNSAKAVLQDFFNSLQQKKLCPDRTVAAPATASESMSIDKLSVRSAVEQTADTASTSGKTSKRAEDHLVLDHHARSFEKDPNV